MPEPAKIFIAYSRKDAAFLEELRVHLKPLEYKGAIQLWYDGNIEPGVQWENAIQINLKQADIILLLVSPDAIASDYFYGREMTEALERHRQGTARVIPLILRPCAWMETPLAELQVLPKDGRPVSGWLDRDEAYHNAVMGLNTTVNGLKTAPRETKSNVETTNPKPAKTERDPLFTDPFQGLMIRIPGGSFEMGDTLNEGIEEPKPVHKVTLPDFCLSQYPVTQGQWMAVMGENPSHFKGDDQLPVEGVSWDNAQSFIRILNEKTGLKYRLPTEAEWEYAAKGGPKSKGYSYAGSNSLDEVGWYLSNSDKKNHPVGQKQPNELGLYDMSGNVWEWCQDVWHNNYQGAPTDGSAWMTGGELARRVVRGGSWYVGDNLCRSAFRYRYDADYKGNNIGCRLARY